MVDQMLSKSKTNNRHNPRAESETNFAYWQRYFMHLAALLVDETDKLSDKQAGFLGEIFDYRYRNRKRLFTGFCMNETPWGWSAHKKGEVAYITSRLIDGRHALKSPTGYITPVLQLTVTDIRPKLQE